MSAKIENHLTREITCPYCGQEFSDSGEYADSDDDRYCDACDHSFSYERQVDVSYTSYRKEEDCEHEEQNIFCDYCGKDLRSSV